MKGSSHGRAVVDEKQVAWIRRTYRPEMKGGGHVEQPGSVRHLAATVGLSRKQVQRIVRGENWK